MCAMQEMEFVTLSGRTRVQLCHAPISEPIVEQLTLDEDLLGQDICQALHQASLALHFSLS